MNISKCKMYFLKAVLIQPDGTYLNSKNKYFALLLPYELLQ